MQVPDTVKQFVPWNGNGNDFGETDIPKELKPDTMLCVILRSGRIISHVTAENLHWWTTADVLCSGEGTGDIVFYARI